MTSDLPAWTEFDPGAPPSLVHDQPGRVVALVAGDAALEAGWAGDVALGVARTLEGRVVVADAGFARPVLGEAAGAQQDEGLTDIVLWGASIGRVARRGEGGVFLVPAGTPVADGAAVLAEPRWAALCDGCRQAGVTLAVLVPASQEGLDAVLGQADDVVLVVGPAEDTGMSDEHRARVRAVVGRVAVPAEGVAEVEDLAPDETPETADEPPATDLPLVFEAEPEEAIPAAYGSLDDAIPVTALWSPESLEGVDPDIDEPEPADWGEPEEQIAPAAPEELDAPAPDEMVGPAHDDAHEFDPADDAGEDPLVRPSAELQDVPAPSVPSAPSFQEIVDELDSVESSRRSRRGSGRKLGLAAVLVLLLVLAAGAVYLGYLEVPGFPMAEPATPTATTGGAVAAPAPAATTPVQGYSLAVGAYQDEAVATQTAERLSSAVTDAFFITVPVDVAGTVFHRVLAGPAHDSVEAADLATRVAAASSADPAGWVARFTPRAFQLGEMPGLEAAHRRVEVLVGLGIPAYVLAVDYDDGSVRYRVYAGAYADADEASYLSGLLQERGLGSSATLSDRTGRLPE